MISVDSTERLIKELERTAPGNVRFRHAYTAANVGHGARYVFQGEHVIFGRTAACAFMIAAIVAYNEKAQAETPPWVHALDSGLNDRRVATTRKMGAEWGEACFSSALHQDAQTHQLDQKSGDPELESRLTALRNGHMSVDSRSQRERRGRRR